MFDLTNKTIIITGGTGLLGSAFSKACAEYGANVVIVDIKERKGNNLVKKIKKETGNDTLIFQKCDITNRKDIMNLIESTLNKFKKIDVLVNNAYPRNKNFGAKFEDVSYEDFCENISLHLGGYFLITKEVSEVMKKQSHGNIINIASIYGFSAPDFRIYKGTDMTMPVEYSAIKGGIINFTKYLATYLAEYAIRVNCISPGGIFNNQPKSFVKKYSEKTPMGRMGKPEDIVGGLIYLASDASLYITGHNLIIDGGWSIW